MSSSKYKVKDIFKAPGNVIILNITPTSGEIFDYIPGQYAMISPYDKNGLQMSSRPFSIASSPTQKNYLQFGIKVTGKFTKRLSELKIGDKISVYGPYGEFTYNEKKYPDSVFIAGGIGITPFINSIRYSNEKQSLQNITLLYSSRKIETATFKNELEDISEKNKNLKTIFSITDENIASPKENTENRRIDTEMLLKYSKPIKNKTFFICGPEKFMEAMENKLLSIGVKSKNIKYEIFSVDKPIGKSKNIRNMFIVYAGSLAVLLLFLYSISNAENVNTEKVIPEIINTNNVLINRNISSINKIALARKNNIQNLQRESIRTSKDTTINRQLKFQENVFKQATSRGQLPTNISIPSQTKPTKTSIQTRIRKILPRTTVS